MAKVSASNVASRKPVSRKASAGGEGQSGAALATVLIQEAEAKAAREQAEYRSLKDRLTEIKALTGADHLEFRKAMVARQGVIEAAAKMEEIS